MLLLISQKRKTRLNSLGDLGRTTQEAPRKELKVMVPSGADLTRVATTEAVHIEAMLHIEVLLEAAEEQPVDND